MGVNKHSPGCGCCGETCPSCLSPYYGLNLTLEFEYASYGVPFGPQGTNTATITLVGSGSEFTASPNITDINVFDFPFYPTSEDYRLGKHEFIFRCNGDDYELIHRLRPNWRSVGVDTHVLTYRGPTSAVCSPIDVLFDTIWDSHTLEGFSSGSSGGTYRNLDASPFFTTKSFPNQTMTDMSIISYRIYG